MTINPIRPTDDDARALARTLLRTARSGSLATLSADSFPFASLILIATDTDGTPLTLVSSLSAHSRNMTVDARVAVLLAKAGKGDPLAHPRLSLRCRATPLDRSSEEGRHARSRILSRHPQSEIYIDFEDFSLVALQVEHASLNGGFGKAYELARDDILLESTTDLAIAAVETEILARLNSEYTQAIANLAANQPGNPTGKWRVSGVDPEGCDLLCKDHALRLPFPRAVTSEDDLFAALALMLETVRAV